MSDRVLVARVPTTDHSDRFVCAAIARRVARSIGFSEREAAELAFVAAELASNAVRHGRGGSLELSRLTCREGIEIACRDCGPGFQSVERALVDGWSRGSFLHPGDAQLGAGLGAVRRVMHSLDVQSTPGRGALVIATRYLGLPLVAPSGVPPKRGF